MRLLLLFAFVWLSYELVRSIRRKDKRRALTFAVALLLLIAFCLWFLWALNHAIQRARGVQRSSETRCYPIKRGTVTYFIALRVSHISCAARRLRPRKIGDCPQFFSFLVFPVFRVLNTCLRPPPYRLLQYYEIYIDRCVQICECP